MSIREFKELLNKFPEQLEIIFEVDTWFVNFVSGENNHVSCTPNDIILLQQDGVTRAYVVYSQHLNRGLDSELAKNVTQKIVQN